MNDTINTIDQIEPPKVSLLNQLKYKLGYFQGRSRVITTIVGVALMSGVSLFVAYASLNRGNVSLNPDNTTGAANPSCYLSLTRKTPTPLPPSITPSPTATVKPTNSPSPKPTLAPTKSPSPKPTASPLAGVCNVTFVPVDHQAICWPTPKPFTVTYKVNSLPNASAVYYMQTDWQVVMPNEGVHHYDETQRIYAGQTYTVTAQWPGIPSPLPEFVEVHLGLNVVDANKNLISPNCSSGLDYYWTPYVCIPNATTSNKTVINPIEDSYTNSAYLSTNSNYGNSATVYSQGSPNQKGFMKFDLTSFTNKSINKATLRMYVSDKSAGVQNIKTVVGNWAESTLKFTNMPPLGSLIATFTPSIGSTWTEVDVTSFANANKGTITSLVIDSTSNDRFGFRSSEASSNKVELVIE